MHTGKHILFAFVLAVLAACAPEPQDIIINMPASEEVQGEEHHHPPDQLNSHLGEPHGHGPGCGCGCGGGGAVEVCDGFDNNGDEFGLIDADDPSFSLATGCPAYPGLNVTPIGCLDGRCYYTCLLEHSDDNGDLADGTIDPGDNGCQGGGPSMCLPEPEVCNGADDDCDGLTDEGHISPGTEFGEFDHDGTDADTPAIALMPFQPGITSDAAVVWVDRDRDPMEEMVMFGMTTNGRQISNGIFQNGLPFGTTLTPTGEGRLPQKSNVEVFWTGAISIGTEWLVLWDERTGPTDVVPKAALVDMAGVKTFEYTLDCTIFAGNSSCSDAHADCANGQCKIAYMDSYPGPGAAIRYASLDADSGILTDHGRILDTPNDPAIGDLNQPQVSMTGSGGATVAFLNITPGISEVSVMAVDANAVAGAFFPLNPGNQYSTHPRIEGDCESGGCWVVWDDSTAYQPGTPTGRDVLISSCFYDVQTFQWLCFDQPLEQTVSSSVGPQLGLTAGGVLWVAWKEGVSNPNQTEVWIQSFDTATDSLIDADPQDPLMSAFPLPHFTLDPDHNEWLGATSNGIEFCLVGRNAFGQIFLECNAQCVPGP